MREEHENFALFHEIAQNEFSNRLSTTVEANILTPTYFLVSTMNYFSMFRLLIYSTGCKTYFSVKINHANPRHFANQFRIYQLTVQQDTCICHR